MSTMDADLASLEHTCNRIADERNKFKADRDALLVAIKDLLAFSSVYTTTDEAFPAQRMAKAAIKLAEERP